MKQRVLPPAVWGILLGVGQLFCSGALFPQSDPATLARQILDATGVRGGLIVHLGCGNGELTAELRATDSYLVHGLDVDSQRVRRARSHIQERGRYGTVSVDKLTGSSLPYNDNLVNLVVSEDPGTVSEDEILRVLAPGGRAAGRWSRPARSIY